MEVCVDSLTWNFSGLTLGQSSAWDMIRSEMYERMAQSTAVGWYTRYVGLSGISHRPFRLNINMDGQEVQYKFRPAKPCRKRTKIADYCVSTSLNKTINFYEFLLTFSLDSSIFPSPIQKYDFIYFETVMLGVSPWVKNIDCGSDLRFLGQKLRWWLSAVVERKELQ
jgi:hypothetical protein